MSIALPTPAQAACLEHVCADEAWRASGEDLRECRLRGWVAGHGDHIVPTNEGAAALKAYRAAQATPPAG